VNYCQILTTHCDCFVCDYFYIFNSIFWLPTACYVNERLFNQKLAPLRELSETHTNCTKIANKQGNNNTTISATTVTTIYQQQQQLLNYCKMCSVARQLLLLPTSRLILLLLIVCLSNCLDAAHSSYNSKYNAVVTPELKQAIDKDLPKQAKFFDELDCKYASSLPKSLIFMQLPKASSSSKFFKNQRTLHRVTIKFVA